MADERRRSVEQVGEQVFTDQQALLAVAEHRAPGHGRLATHNPITQSGFQRATLPVRAAEQIGAQGTIAKVAQATAPAFQAGQWDNGSGQHPGLAVATEPDFANPGPLPGR